MPGQPKIVEVTEVALRVTRPRLRIETVAAAATVGQLLGQGGSRGRGHPRRLRTEQPKAYVIGAGDSLLSCFSPLRSRAEFIRCSDLEKTCSQKHTFNKPIILSTTANNQPM